MKKLFKTIIIFIICFFCLGSTFNNSFADTSLGDIISGGDYFYNSGQDDDIFNEEEIEKGTSQLFFIALGIAIALAVIVGIILGIQLITSGVEGQAKVKEKLLPYIVGCIVIFGGIGIWRAVVSIAESLSAPKTTQQEFIGPQLPSTNKNDSTVGPTKPENPNKQQTIGPQPLESEDSFIGPTIQ